jgi:hypothetical protein
VFAVTVCGLAVAARANEPVDFRREVAPILERHCIRCHQPTNKKGDVSLATFGDLAAGEHVVPGRPDDSGLLELVSPPGPGERPEMPKQGPPLTADQVGVLRRWISQGAHWPAGMVLQTQSQPGTTGWSLRPLAEVTPPVAAPAALPAEWANNPIDRFILAKLIDNGLRPSPPADRRTLIRRVYFDLTGLPPTPEQVDCFVADTDPSAPEKLVDRLLASPLYGERWARHWLDVIHFADTHGHEADLLRPHAWRYRDYVIDSLNRDTPWPRFIREQLAADVFFPNERQLTPALGFLAAGPCDLSAAGTAPMTFEYLDRDDLVTQTMTAFASITVNCARCHAHKFDPITQEDYFALQAVFAGVTKGDVAFDLDAGVTGRRKHYRTLLAAAERRQRDILFAPENESRVALWKRTPNDAETWQSLDDVLLESDGSILERQADGSIRSRGPLQDKETWSLTLGGSPREITALRLDVLADDAPPHRGPGRAHDGNVYLSEFEATMSRPGSGGPEKLRFRRGTADWNEPNRAAAQAIDGDLKTAWGISPEVGRPHHAVFELEQSLALEAGAKLVVVLKQLQGGGHVPGRFRLSASNAPAEATFALPTAVAAALAVPRDQRTLEQRLAVAAALLRVHAEDELARLPAPAKVYAAARVVENHKGAITTIPVPRVIRVLKRGELDNPGGEVPPGTLSAVTGLRARFDQLDPNDEGARRAALADWLADARNPLTWRSIANRVWYHHFGCGLCDTPSDLGCMGGAPSHPELLDWLAARLRASGGSLKEMHRLICTSAVYRQSSSACAAAAAVDPDNRLLWRMNRRRLDAEGLRDTVLAVCGRLELRTGGPGVAQFRLKPGANPNNNTPTVDYSAFDWDSPGATRRSIYRVVWRGAPDPFMSTIDFPDTALLAPVRGVSTSPLQALSLLNNDFVLRQCEHFATRLERLGATPDDCVRAAFRLVLLREPTDSERSDFVALSARHSLAAVGRVLLNSNEFLFVE